MSDYMFRPHRAILRQDIWMESTALCSFMSVIFVDELSHYSQFYYFENVFSFANFVLRFLCAPFCVPPLPLFLYTLY
jgi:hypothetical protein